MREMIDAIRCVRVSPDGKHLACGDYLGNIRIYDLTEALKKGIELLKFIEAHNLEVICLAYSPNILNQPGRYWLASGSRDKLISVYDSSEKYEVMTCFEHHSSTITSLRFYQTKNSELRLVSSGYDKTIVHKKVNMEMVNSIQDFEELQLATEIFEDDKVTQCRNKIVSMDIQEQS